MRKLIVVLIILCLTLPISANSIDIKQLNYSKQLLYEDTDNDVLDDFRSLLVSIINDMTSIYSKIDQLNITTSESKSEIEKIKIAVDDLTNKYNVASKGYLDVWNEINKLKLTALSNKKREVILQFEEEIYNSFFMLEEYVSIINLILQDISKEGYNLNSTSYLDSLIEGNSLNKYEVFYDTKFVKNREIESIVSQIIDLDKVHISIKGLNKRINDVLLSYNNGLISKKMLSSDLNSLKDEIPQHYNALITTKEELFDNRMSIQKIYMLILAISRTQDLKDLQLPFPQLTNEFYIRKLNILKSSLTYIINTLEN